MSSPFSLADLTNNVGLMIWAAIGAVGLLAGFVSVSVAKRRSLKSTQAASAEHPAAKTEVPPPARTAAPSQASSESSSESYSAARTASSKATHASMAHLTRAG